MTGFLRWRHTPVTFFIIIALFKKENITKQQPNKTKKKTLSMTAGSDDLIKNCIIYLGYLPHFFWHETQEASEFWKTKCCSKLKTIFCSSHDKHHWAPVLTVPSKSKRSRRPVWGTSQLSWGWVMAVSWWHTLNVTATEFPIVIYSCPEKKRGFLMMKCHSPAFVSHAHCLYSEATFATFSSCFFSMQTQNLLDWWRHFHGFEELRSGSAQVGAEFPTVIFITTIVMKH